MAITPSKYLKGKQKSTTFNFKQSLENRIGADTYNTDIEQFNKDYGSDYLSNWHSADEINAYYDRLTDLNDRTKAYQTFVSNYGTDEQKSALENIGKQVSAYDEIIGARQDVLDYYGSFANADAYAKGIEYAQQQEAAYKAEQERIASLNVDFVKTSIANIDTSIANYEQKYRSATAKPATTPQEQQTRASLMNSYQAMLDDLKATKSSLEADITARELYDRNKKYTDILGSEEFASFVPTEDKSYDAVEKGNNPEAAISTVGHTTSGVGLSTADMALFQSYGSARYGEMTDEEYKLYKYLQETYGQEVAAQYAYDLDNELISRYQDRFRTYAEEHPILGTIASFVTSPLQGVDFVSGALEKAITGNVRQGELTATTSAMREGAKQTITNGNKVGGFLYDTGMSMLDSILAMSLGGSAGGAILGASAASSAQNDVLARGGTAEQALASGLASGFFEGFFESFSIGALSKMQPKEIVKNFKVFATNALKSVATNASEELATEIANIVFDSAYMGELSNAAIMFDQYMRQGLTEAEAKNKVAHELGVQALGAAASGALMGFGFSAFGGGVGLSKVDRARVRLGKKVITEGKLETLLPEMEEYYKGEGHAEEQKLLKKIKEGIGKESTSVSMKRAAGKLIERYSEAKYKEKNKKVAEQSAENLNKTRENATQEANKVKVDTVSPDINYDNMPKILGFDGANLNKTIIETADGASALTDVSISNADIASIYSYAVRLGNAESANAFIENWDQQSEPFQYYLDFLKFQTRGLYAPESYDNTMSDYADVKISPMAKHAAFKSGISLRESAREKAIKQSEALKEEYKKLGGKAKKGKFNDSKLNYSTLTQQQKDVVNFTRILSDYLGVNVEYFVSQKGRRGVNGYYRQSNNTIYLDINAGIKKNEVYSVLQDCLVNTISHEVVHNMKVTAPAEYNALRDFIIDRLSKQEGYDLDARIEQIVLENSKQGFTAEDAIEEIVAMSCEDLLGSSAKLQEAMSEFYEQNEKAANSFTKFVREVLARLKAFFETIINKKSGTAESMLMAKQSAKVISELQKRYDAALLAMREGNAVRNTQNATEGEKIKEQKRGEETKNIFGYEINKNASVNEDLLEELRIYDPDAEVNENGEITVYHRTSKDNATAIRKTGIMKAKEDALFFSSKPEGYATDYGDTVVTLRIPSTKLRINDIFDGEVHFDMPLKRIAGQWSANVSQWLVDDEIDRVFGEGEKVMRQTRAIMGESGRYYGIGVHLDSTLLTDLTDDERIEMVKEYVKELGGNDFVAYDSNYNMVSVHIAESSQRFINKSGKKVPVNKDLTNKNIKFTTKQESIALVDELILTAKHDSNKPAMYSHDWVDNYGKNDWEYWVTYVEDKEKTIWEATLNIATSANGEKILYDINPIKMVEQSISLDTSTTANSISQPDPNVNPSDEKTFNQTRADNSANRELLANALESTIDTTTEEGQEQLKRLKEYKNSIKRIKTLEKQRADLVDKGMELMRKKGKSAEENAELKSIWEQTKSLEKKISLRDKDLLRLEALKPIQRLLYREKAKAEKEAKKQGLEKQKEIRENYTRKEYIRKIEERAKGFRDALTKNSKDKHIPEPFKAVVADMITALDFSSKRKLAGKGETKKDVKIATAMRELATMMTGQNQKSTGEVQSFLMACDITDDFAQEFMDINNEIAGISEKVSGIAAENELVLQKMTSEQLRRLNSALYKLGNQINAANKLMENNLYKNVNEMGSELMRYAKQFKKKKQAGVIKQMLDTDQLTAYYAFKRMGKVGVSWFDEWADGWDMYSYLSDEIVDTAKKSWTVEEVKKWTNDVHEFTIRGEKYYLTTAHLMSFYLLYKQQDSRRHLDGYGMVVEDFTTDPDIKNATGKKYSNLNTGTYLTTEDITQLLTTLEEDKRAIEVADKIQHFMATTCADWANYVTMRRFGEKAYTIEDYFPIESSDKDMPTKKKDEGVKISLYSLLNKAFTKLRNLKANNKIMIRNVFDVFASHTTEVAAYRAFAIPLLDTLKLYNYQTTTEVIENGEVKEDRKSMQEVLADAFGNDFNQYIENLIRDITGANPPQRNTAIEKAANFLVSKTKVASVAFNFRVAALQGTSYIRASAVLDHKYLLKELKDTPQLRRAITTMNEYSGIAVWKTKLGFRDVNITRSLQDKIKHKETALDKFNDFAMKGAEIGDRLTWGAIWLACEEETKDKRKELSVGSKEFYKAVAKRFREVIYATQVVDSPLAKSQVMRSKSEWTRLMTNFMAEPTVSYNLLLDAYSEAAIAKQRGVKLSRQNYLKIGRLVVVYIESQIVQAAVESVVDALRRIANDEEDETFIEAYFDELWRNILQELNVLEKIPYVKNVYDVAEKYLLNGYSYNQNMEIAVFEKLFKSGSDFKKFVEGDISITKLIKSVLDAVSSMFGIPLSNMYRTVRTIWNNTMEMFNDGSGRIE